MAVMVGDGNFFLEKGGSQEWGGWFCNGWMRHF